MPEGLFQGLISGLVGGIGDGVLQHEERQYQERQENKKARLQVLQHAFDSGKLDEKGEDAAFQELLQLTMGGAEGKGKGGGKQLGEAQKLLHGVLLPIKLLRKLGGGGAGKEQLPQAPTRSAGGGQTETTSRGGEGLPSVPQRAAPHVMAFEERQKREQTAKESELRGQLRIQNEVEDEHHKKLLEALPEEEKKTLDSTFSAISDSYKKYFGKDPDDKTKQRIFEQSYEKAFGVKAPTYRAPQQLGNVHGEDYGLAPGLYKHARDQDGNDQFDKIDEKKSKWEQDRADAIGALQRKAAKAGHDLTEEEAGQRLADMKAEEDDLKHKVLEARLQSTQLTVRDKQFFNPQLKLSLAMQTQIMTKAEQIALTGISQDIEYISASDENTKMAIIAKRIQQAVTALEQQSPATPPTNPLLGPGKGAGRDSDPLGILPGAKR